MSRSYKKSYVVEPLRSRKYYKRLAAKVVRRLLKEPDLINISYKKYYNSWNICDYKFRVSKFDLDFQKYSRK